MNKIATFAIGLWLSIGCAFAQTSPNLTFGFVPTPAQWNSYFAGKSDYLGAPPLLITGGTMTGPLNTVASTAGTTGFNIAPGTAPTSPNNGDIWETTIGIFARINGSTVGPLIGGTQTANTILGNASGTGTPVALAIPSCSGAANGLQWVLNTGFQCGTITAAASSVAIGTTTITSGTIGNVLYHATSNLLGELTTTGTGTVLALATGAALTTPTIGSPTITTPVFSGTITGTYTLGGTPSIAGSAINSGSVSGTYMSAVNLAASGNGGVTGVLPIANGGTGQSTATLAIAALMPTPTRAGDVAVWNGSAWTTLAGNNSGTQVFSENASGVAAWLTASGTGTVTTLTQGTGVSFSSGTTCTTSCTVNGAITEAQGRLTLAANTPVMGPTSCSGSPCTNITTLRYDCYLGGGNVPYFNGSIDLLDSISSCEVTDAMVAASSAGQVVASQVYDVWWVHGGANRICLAMSSATGGGGGWASDTGGSNTARGTGYSQLDRVTRPYPTNKNSITNCFNAATNYGPVSANQGTYLGTVYANANGQISFTFGGVGAGGVPGLFGVWNMFNRVNTKTKVTDTAASWNVAGNTVQPKDGSGNNRVSFVVGVQEDWATASIMGVGDSGASSNVGAAIGYNSSSAISGMNAIGPGSISGPSTGQDSEQSIGFNFFQALDANTGSSTSTLFGTATGGAFYLPGMMFDMRM